MKNYRIAILYILSITICSCGSSYLSFNKRKYLERFKSNKTLAKKNTPKVNQPILITGDLKSDYQKLVLIDEADDASLYLMKSPRITKVIPTNYESKTNLIRPLIRGNDINLTAKDEAIPTSDYANKKGSSALTFAILGILTIWFGVGFLFIIIGFIEGKKSLKAGKLNPENYTKEGAAKFAVVIGYIAFSVFVILLGTLLLIVYAFGGFS